MQPDVIVPSATLLGGPVRVLVLNEGGKIDNFWEGAVLDVWYNDATSKTEAEFRVYTSSLTTQMPLRSGSDKSIESSIYTNYNNYNHQFRIILSPSIPS